MSVAYRPSTKQQRWLLKIGHEGCWLPEIPAISAAGQLTLKVDACFVLTFHSWLAGWLAGKGHPLSGDISAFDYGLNEKLRYTFSGASVASVAFPTLDGSLQTPGRVTLTLQARNLTPTFGSGQHGVSLAKPVPWRCSDFGVVIANVDPAKVSRVDAITVAMPGGLANVRLLVSAGGAKQFADWQASGAPAPAKIHFLAPDRATSLFTLGLTAKVSAIQHATGGANGSRAHAGQTGKVPVVLTAAGLSLAKG